MLITRAPLRISFFGGGTDYPEHFRTHGGAVLGAAVDKFCHMTASPFHSGLFEHALRISYSRNELVRTVDEVEHNVFRECLKLLGFTGDIELHAVADLPAFTGLGSSSAFTVSLLHALHAMKGEYLRPLDLAYEAIYVEREVLGDVVGCQDQTFAAVGGFARLDFHSEREIEVSRVPISAERLRGVEQHLAIVFTGQRRRAADVARAQLQRVADNCDRLGRMHRMVDDGWRILVENRPLAEFGELLHESWMQKRALDGGVTNDEIDVLYERGRSAGAIGGKLLGAGGGGFLLFFAPPETHERLLREFTGHHVLHVRLNAPGSQVIFAS